MDEFVEEGVFAVVRGPDGEVAGPGDAGLSGLPEEIGVGMLREFVESDVAAIDGHGIRIGGEGDDAGAVLKSDVADLNFFGERGRLALRIEGLDFNNVFAVAEDCAGVAEHVSEVVNLVHVFERAGPVFGDEEVIAVWKAEAFADIFETIAKSPADADGFFGEGEDLPFSFVERVLGFDPADLVGSEIPSQKGRGIDFGERQNSAHKRLHGYHGYIVKRDPPSSDYGAASA